MRVALPYGKGPSPAKHFADDASTLTKRCSSTFIDNASCAMHRRAGLVSSGPRRAFNLTALGGDRT